MYDFRRYDLGGRNASRGSRAVFVTVPALGALKALDSDRWQLQLEEFLKDHIAGDCGLIPSVPEQVAMGIADLSESFSIFPIEERVCIATKTGSDVTFVRLLSEGGMPLSVPRTERR